MEVAAGVADLAGMGELMQQGAQHVDRAAVEGFAADQDLGPAGPLGVP